MVSIDRYFFKGHPLDCLFHYFSTPVLNLCKLHSRSKCEKLVLSGQMSLSLQSYNKGRPADDFMALRNQPKTTTRSNPCLCLSMSMYMNTFMSMSLPMFTSMSMSMDIDINIRFSDFNLFFPNVIFSCVFEWGRDPKTKILKTFFLISVFVLQILYFRVENVQKVPCPNKIFSSLNRSVQV